MPERVGWWWIRTWIWSQGQSSWRWWQWTGSNLNNIWGTSKESKDEDSNSGQKSLIQELDKDEKIGGKSKKISQILQIKFGKTLMLLKNSKQKWKHIKNHRTVLTYSWKNAIKRFGKNEWRFRIVIKTWKCKKSRGKSQRSICHMWSHK